MNRPVRTPKSNVALRRAGPRPLASARLQPPAVEAGSSRNEPRYARDDLFAVAEVAYHYLMNGAAELARVLFEGLSEVAPEEPYFALATGLACQSSGDRESALDWYERAAKLDPSDPRTDLNRAEIHIARRELDVAVQLLSRAQERARRCGEPALERKAGALLQHIIKQRRRRIS